MTLRGKSSLAILAVLFAACTEEVRPRGRSSVAEIDAWSQDFSSQFDAGQRQGVAPSKKPGTMVMAREDGPAWDWSDPCVENLHELTGLLLLYFQEHKELPERLTALSPKAIGGEDRTLHCPRTHKDYVYVREGLVPPLDIVPVPQRPRGGDKLIVYDAESTHDITQRLTDGVKDWDVKKKVRYGIVMKPQTGDGTLMLQVVPVEQALLDAYVRETKNRANNERLFQQVPPQNLRPNTGGLW